MFWPQDKGLQLKSGYSEKGWKPACQNYVYDNDDAQENRSERLKPVVRCQEALEHFEERLL